MTEIASQRNSCTELDPSCVDQLLKHDDPEVGEQAKQLLADFVLADRKQVLDVYHYALSLDTDPRRGRNVFEKNCVMCHKISNLRVDIGPDISDSFRKTPEALLESILIPNKVIDSNHVSYTVSMVDGKIHAGIVAQETLSSITLKQAENRTVTVLRQDIEKIRSAGVSLMHDGLEKNVTIEQMDDLIAIIKNWQYLQ